MPWWSHAKEELEKGNKVQIRPKGHSMAGKIESGQLVTLEPVEKSSLKKDDVVLCRVKGAVYLHLIKAIDSKTNKFLIGNNKGHINGWTGTIYGKVIKVE